MKKLFTLIRKRKKDAKPLHISKSERDKLFKSNRNLFDVERVVKQKKFFESI